MSVKRVGVIGGGQLAWMMADAAKSLGIDLIVQTPSREDPAVGVASDVVLAKIDDIAATATLANQCEAITFENEFINLTALKPLEERGVCFRPRLDALAPLLDKYQQRCYLQSIGLPVPRFAALEANHSSQLPFPLPVVLKVRRHGYDGQGTLIIRTQEELEASLKGLQGKATMIEEFVPFERELAVIVARGVTGEVVLYPVVETQQENQVCHRVLVPALVSEAVKSQVKAIAQTLLDELEAVGVFGIELFLTADGKVLVNEIAPRTHNSGHYTLDACQTSQFEMQLRAVANLPLSSPRLKTEAAVMVNLLGYEDSHSDYAAKRSQLASINGACVHWYGKTPSRPGRKLGHVTVLLSNSDPVYSQKIAQQIESIWYGGLLPVGEGGRGKG